MGRTPGRKQPRAAFRALVLVGAALALAAAVVLAPSSRAQSDLPPAPPYAATTLDGVPVSLEDLRGQTVMLNVWATWCTPCLEEMPKLQALQDEYADRGLVVIGTSIDKSGEEENVRAMADSLGVRYAIWLDPEERAKSDFRLMGVPATFLITAEGTIAHQWRGQFEPLSNETRSFVDAALVGEAIEPPRSVAGLGLAVAFTAGALSFLSPCVFPLVPSYVAVVSGMSLDELMAADRARVQRRVLLNGLVFVAGFTTTFLLLGASASMLGGLFSEHRDWLTMAGGVFIVLMGLLLLGVLRIPGADREMRLRVKHEGVRRVGVYVMGFAFGAGWTPCIGPVLAGVLTLAASTASLGEGMRLLLAYSVGLAIPFLAAALALRRLLPSMGRVGRMLPVLHKASGVLLIVMGVLLLTGGMTLLTTWLVRYTPDALRGLG